MHRALETEERVLLQSDHYLGLLHKSIHLFLKIVPNFMPLSNREKRRYVLGEISGLITTAAGDVAACHELRETASGHT